MDEKALIRQYETQISDLKKKLDEAHLAETKLQEINAQKEKVSTIVFAVPHKGRLKKSTK
jgi:cellobiose-specific phosphotransferase system component IIA